MRGERGGSRADDGSCRCRDDGEARRGEAGSVLLALSLGEVVSVSTMKTNAFPYIMDALGKPLPTGPTVRSHFLKAIVQPVH